MKRLLIAAVGTLGLGAAAILPAIAVSPAVAQSAAIAEVQTTTFDVPNMTCALCPVTVRKAMESVRGVRQVEIDFDARTATVVFDPTLATVEAISAALANAGYPATVKS